MLLYHLSFVLSLSSSRCIELLLFLYISFLFLSLFIFIVPSFRSLSPFPLFNNLYLSMYGFLPSCLFCCSPSFLPSLFPSLTFLRSHPSPGVAGCRGVHYLKGKQSLDVLSSSGLVTALVKKIVIEAAAPRCAAKEKFSFHMFRENTPECSPLKDFK